MKNIVITNCYGYQNIGDAAILEGTIRIINKAISEKTIYIHSATVTSEKIDNVSGKYLHPYGIAIKNETCRVSNPEKIMRFMTIVPLSLWYAALGTVSPAKLPENGDYAYIRSLKQADMVLGSGGGYLRTKNKYRDYFGLILTLLPIVIAHIYRKRILYLPISYGNFAVVLHAGIAFHVIKHDRIIFRDEISLREFNKDANKELDTYFIPDIALFDTYKNTKNIKKTYIVVTGRQWLRELKQKKYESELALFIEYVWKVYKLKTIFIPMVRNKLEDDDIKVGNRIMTLVKNKNIYKIATVKTPLQVKKILAGAKVAICTRMHCAIFSTIVKTPFITIAYEQKTLGFLNLMKLEKWNINIENFSCSLLQEKFDDLVKNNYQQFKITLNRNHKEVLKKESELIQILKILSLAS